MVLASAAPNSNGDTDIGGEVCAAILDDDDDDEWDCDL